MSAQLNINGKIIDNCTTSSIFELAKEISIDIPTSCKKLGKCKECLIEIEDGNDLLSLRTEFEKHLKENFRLACQCHITKQKGVVKCHTLQRGSFKIETSLNDSNKNKERLIDPAVTKVNNVVFLDGIQIESVTEDTSIYGLAIDLGTTTIVMRLINLETGKLMATSSFENPQRFGGSDVMSRIQYETENTGRVLQRILMRYISLEIEKMPISGNEIFEVVVAGNSTMRDLFFGIDVYSIGQMPYRSLTEIELIEGKINYTDIFISPKKLKLPIHPKGRIYGLPLISGHVGADTSACLLAINIFEEKKPIILMDIGTNTEIIIGNKDRLIAASCPAGPAFEGGGVDCGVPGLDGAIERIKISKDNSVETQVIGNGKPIGICGSGLIDGLAELLKNDIMNSFGRFEDEHVFIIDKEAEIYISEKDINELAQAKGANIAGFNIALKKYGKNLSEIAVFYVAGGFGRHINIENSQYIGFVPNLPKSKINQIGNATIEGAEIALLSLSARNKLKEFVKGIEHVNLETDPDFFDYFVEGCQFKKIGIQQNTQV